MTQWMSKLKQLKYVLVTFWTKLNGNLGNLG